MKTSIDLVELVEDLDEHIENLRYKANEDEFYRGYINGMITIREDVNGWLPTKLQKNEALRP